MESGFTIDALDALFAGVKGYRSSTNFFEMMKFCKRMKVLAPYNAMLAYLQRPGAKHLLNENKWQTLFGRGIKPDARPVLVLIPFGPLEYLFDVSDTYPLPDSKYNDSEMEKVIEELSAPFDARGKVDPTLFQNLKRNLAIFGIAYNPSMVAGRGFCAKLLLLEKQQEKLEFVVGKTTLVYGANFLLSVNSKAGEAERFASIIHELGHYFCRHLEAPHTPKEWWDHRNLSHEVEEFEAESISWLICKRLGIDTPSDKYLHGYLDKNDEIPKGISMDIIFKSANDIWRMLVESMPLSKGILYKCDKNFTAQIKALREKPFPKSLFPGL